MDDDPNGQVKVKVLGNRKYSVYRCLRVDVVSEVDHV